MNNRTPASFDRKCTYRGTRTAHGRNMHWGTPHGTSPKQKALLLVPKEIFERIASSIECQTVERKTWTWGGNIKIKIHRIFKGASIVIAPFGNNNNSERMNQVPAHLSDNAAILLFSVKCVCFSSARHHSSLPRTLTPTGNSPHSHSKPTYENVQLIRVSTNCCTHG